MIGEHLGYNRLVTFESSRLLKYVIFAGLTMPTIVLLAAIVAVISTGRSADLPPFVGGLIGILVLLSFPVSVALAFVFPTIKELRLASAINAIPLIFAILLGLLFWMAGIES